MTSYSTSEKNLCLNIDILRFLPPCRCNRNDNGDQKSIDINGTRRLYVSSQCIKSNIRKYFGFKTFSDISYIENKLNNYSEDMEDESYYLAVNDYKSIIEGKTINNDNSSKKKTRGKKSNKNSEDVDEETTETELESETESSEKNSVCIHTSLKELYEERKKCDEKRNSVDKDKKNKKDVKVTYNPNIEISLFGRMYAKKKDDKDKNLNVENVESACQVSHAVSVQKTEFEDDTWVCRHSDMSKLGCITMGTLNIGSAIVYYSVNLNIKDLLKKYNNDVEAVKKYVAKFLFATYTHPLESGANGTNHNNQPLFFNVTIGNFIPHNHLDVFYKPVEPDSDIDSIKETLKKSIQEDLEKQKQIIKKYNQFADLKLDEINYYESDFCNGFDESVLNWIK